MKGLLMALLTLSSMPAIYNSDLLIAENLTRISDVVNINTGQVVQYSEVNGTSAVTTSTTPSPLSGLQFVINADSATRIVVHADVRAVCLGAGPDVMFIDLYNNGARYKPVGGLSAIWMSNLFGEMATVHGTWVFDVPAASTNGLQLYVWQGAFGGSVFQADGYNSTMSVTTYRDDGKKK